MADFSKMEFSALEKLAGDFDKGANMVQQLIDLCNQAVGAAQSGWGGDDAQAFMDTWDSSKKTVEKLKEALEAYSPALKKSAEAEKNRVTAVSSAMKNLTF